MTTKARRLSVYVSPKDTEVLTWMDGQTANGTSESEAILRLIRKEARGEPTETERALREEIARLHDLLRLVIGGRVVPAPEPPTNSTPSGGSHPPDAMIALEGENWSEW